MRRLLFVLMILCSPLPVGATESDTYYFSPATVGHQFQPWPGAEIPNSLAVTGVAPVSTANSSQTSLILKNSAGNLYDLNVTTGSTAGYVEVFNSSTVPSTGTVSPALCFSLAANSTLILAWHSSPLYFSNGIVVVFSSASTCATYTASSTAFIAGAVK